MAERNSHVDRGFWNIYYGKLLQALGVSEDSICRDLIAYTRVSANWCDIRPGTRAVLERLRQNFRLGVISNSDGKIAEVLSRCGIADVFESITDSGNVGKEKPHPEIFNSALRSLGVSPEASTYIGDVYCVDYVGATRCGMSAILFDVAGAYKESALPRVESLEELASRLLDSSEMPIR
jgi:HAD superfamily hydrolase (TIGR01549 family)